MATPTSSSNRSKRKGTKPITQGQNPQRGNRQKVSNAQVTNSSTRGSNTGSAKVTTGRGGGPGKPKALPSAGQSGGSKPPKGTTVPQRGGPTRTPEQLAQERRSAAAAQKAGSRLGNGAAKAPSTGTPVGAATKAATRGSNLARGARTLAGRAMGPLAVGTTAGTAYLDARRRGETRGRAAGQGAAAAGGFAAGAAAGARIPGPPIVKGAAALAGGAIGSFGAVRAMQGTQEAAKRAGGENRPKQGNAQSRFAGAREANLNRINNDTRFSAPQQSAKPPARPSASRPSQSTPSRSTASGGGGSQRSAAPQSTKPAMPGRKWDDFNPGRGTSKSNNPLLDRDSGGMKLRDRMKQREASAQSEKAKNLSSNFGQDSGYQPQTKVDGSKYADKKPDMKKVNEYDRRKRRYYD